MFINEDDNKAMATSIHTTTPAQAGYYFPAEFAPHEAMWLSWPHKEASWPDKIDSIFPYYALFIKEVSKSELVRINVADEAMKNFAVGHLQTAGVDLSRVQFFSILPMMPGAAIMDLPSW